MNLTTRPDLAALSTSKRLRLALIAYRSGATIQAALTGAGLTFDIWADALARDQAEALALAAAIEARYATSAPLSKPPPASDRVWSVERRAEHRERMARVRAARPPAAAKAIKRAPRDATDQYAHNAATGIRATLTARCTGSLPDGTPCLAPFGNNDAAHISPLCHACRRRCACFFYHRHPLPYCS